MPESKIALRTLIEVATENFIAAGGVVRPCPLMESGEGDMDVAQLLEEAA